MRVIEEQLEEIRNAPELSDRARVVGTYFLALAWKVGQRDKRAIFKVPEDPSEPDPAMFETIAEVAHLDVDEVRRGWIELSLWQETCP